MNYLIIIIAILFVFFQENTYQSNMDSMQSHYEKEIEKKELEIKSLKKDKDKLILEKINYTNVILDDMQDDINLQFNQNEELNQLILKKNISLLKKIKCEQ